MAAWLETDLVGSIRAAPGNKCYFLVNCPLVLDIIPRSDRQPGCVGKLPDAPPQFRDEQYYIVTFLATRETAIFSHSHLLKLPRVPGTLRCITSSPKILISCSG